MLESPKGNLINQISIIKGISFLAVSRKTDCLNPRITSIIPRKVISSNIKHACKIYLKADFPSRATIQQANMNQCGKTPVVRKTSIWRNRSTQHLIHTTYRTRIAVQNPGRSKTAYLKHPCFGITRTTS